MQTFQSYFPTIKIAVITITASNYRIQFTFMALVKCVRTTKPHKTNTHNEYSIFIVFRHSSKKTLSGCLRAGRDLQKKKKNATQARSQTYKLN